MYWQESHRHALDSELVALADGELRTHPGLPHIIFVHLIGSHSDPASRYPAGFGPFDGIRDAAASPSAQSVCPAACGTAGCLPGIWLIAPIASVIALIVARIFYKKMMAANEGNDKMREIAGYVREGAMAYLFRQYKVVGMVFLALFVICFFY